MTDSLQATEDASAAVAKAPRISKEFIESQIVETTFVTGDELIAGIGKHLYAHLTLCLIRVSNGFMVVGTSAPMSPENFNRQLGQSLAYENAFRQLWPLYAFAHLEDEHLFEQEAMSELRTNSSNNDGETAPPSPESK